MPEFKIEQIALCPFKSEPALKLLHEMGLTDWAHDTVVAKGEVFSMPAENTARLAFNYQGLEAARELEVLHYDRGGNWMMAHPSTVSHLGMHCSEEELKEWRVFFAEREIRVMQEVRTQSHTNPVIAGKRWYTYVIFGTRHILGVDLKFIVRRDNNEG